VVDAYEEWFEGYREDPREYLSRTFDDVKGYDDIVMLRDIDVESHCEHHMAPFLGKAFVAYMPLDNVVGISKLARVVEIYAKRLQTQETMTSQILNAIQEVAEAAGRRRPDRRQARVHDDTRRSPPERLDHHHPVHRRVQDGQGTARAVSALGGAVRPSPVSLWRATLYLSLRGG
jgi:hypothetical protein